ncbi:hypothetical protein BGZ96_001799 [Linnemannia gamsii]|uniref:FAD-binding PCMH-type domain-containing protein n=1 Tax=Linnemannia gamsii TaxID=64522 RepID=A0ABQ7JLN2_9FUNG|nr:hypothetical protein BGZ96_001799 [Linnemannia gamsii]
MTSAPDTVPLPGFTTLYKRGEPEYNEHCYQYASSSHTHGIIQPKYIIYPAGDDEVIKAIQYAKANKLAVAVRTGGHQYSGASSTYGDNIQLALSRTYVDFRWENTDCTLVTVGVSYPLRVFHDKLAAKGRFVPHGQCSHVHLGGHVQTGGYGQLGRSFGLLADHVQKIRIITADGQPREIRRGIEEDKDLFFAVLGGSPGNFGVITHVTIKVHRDEDHPQARGLKILYLYNRNRLKRLLDVMVQMANDKSFPADYDYCLTVLSADSLVFPSFSPDLDEKMRTDHPETFGVDGLFVWPPMIVVYAQWANIEGKGQPFNKSFFDQIKQAGGEILDIPFLGVRVDYDKPRPLSELTGQWIFQNVREFEEPYIKRTFMSNSKTLVEDGWTTYVCDRIHEIESNPFNGCDLSVQIQHFGGDNSRTYQNNDGSTAISWRDSHICAVLDCFHRPYPSAWETANAWQKENDKSVGHKGAKFCEEDRRVLWGSHDLNLDKEHVHYFDNAHAVSPKTKYERLCEIKKKVDPDGVFTPNGFCVGAPPVAAALSDEVEDRKRQLDLGQIAQTALSAIESTFPSFKALLLKDELKRADTLTAAADSHVQGQAEFMATMSNDREMAAKLRKRRAEHEKQLENQPEELPGGSG